MMTIHDQTSQDNPQNINPPMPNAWFQTCSPQELGTVGELIALKLLTEGGYLVEHAHGFDLTAAHVFGKTIKRIEVKTARMSVDGGYQFTLLKEGHTDHRKSDWLVLICITPDGAIYHYEIPTSATMLMTKIEIPTDPRSYRGRWCQYLGEYHQADLVE